MKKNERKMAEENKKGSDGGGDAGKGATGLPPVFFWVAYFSFTAFLVLVAAVFFQVQLVSIRHELATLRLNLTGCEEEKLRILRKRSSAEQEQDELGQGIQAAHLQGTHPFQRIERLGRIGPWTASSSNHAFISLKNKNMEVEISQSGIYYIYAQIYYLTSEPHNSFQILSYNGTQELKDHRHVATCACQGTNTMGEVSCHTGFTGVFRSGDRLYLNQIEQNRIIHFGTGCSHFGMILLRKNGTMKLRT